MKIFYRGFEEFGRAMIRKAEGLRKEMEQTTRKAVLYVHSTVPGYPGEPAGSRYRRTGQMGRSITTEVKAVGVSYVGVIGTATIYAPWVISEVGVGGRGPQTSFHKAHGWWTLHGIVRKAFPKVVELYREMWLRWLMR